MSLLRRGALLRWALLVTLVFTTWVGRVASSADAVRYVHEYCEEHETVEHRDGADEGVADSGNHDPCSLPPWVAAEPPELPTLSRAEVLSGPIPPPPPATGAGAPRAPPLSFAPKTSPPAGVS
jgi:hypothetical protein